MRVSVSEIKLYLQCPMKWYFRYRLNREPRRLEQALEVGTLVHVAFEALLKGQDWQAAAEAKMAESQQLPGGLYDNVVDEYNRLSQCLAVWELPEDYEIVSVEEEIEIPVGDRHSIVGRLDTVVSWNGSYWHMQHKSLAASKPVHIYAEQQRTDFHEIVYHRMATTRGYNPFAGTILNGVRKLAASTLAKAGPKSALFHLYLPREEWLVDEGIADLIEVIDQMEAAATGKPLKNRSACGGMFGNSLCGYKQVCDHEIEIDSPEFRDAEVRYANTKSDTSDTL